MPEKKTKFSTGYFTPQGKGTKRSPKVAGPSSVSGSKIDSAMPRINDSIYEKIMSCPLKRQLVLSLIESEKDNIEKYKKKQAKQKFNENSGSPLRRVQKKNLCESPTALLRRRALELQNQNTLSESNSDSISNSGSTTSSRQSVAATSPVPLDKLLDGVVAYVEIKSRNLDRSPAVKALTASMGATIKDSFTRDVTHVIFKGGSFTTYQKANLLNIHLVSVLWLEACRSSGRRVSESRFPALGTDAYGHNVSTICSQMQKEYEEIVKEEYEHCIRTGTPLPSTQALIDRRRTMMTPNISRRESSQETTLADTEVANIFCRGRRYSVSTHPEMTLSSEVPSDDDSDLVALIDGEIISTKKKNDLTSDDNIINETMDFTALATEVNKIFSKEKASSTPAELYDMKTPKIKSSVSRRVTTSGKNHDKLLTSTEVSNETITFRSPKLHILSKNVSIVSPNMVKNNAASSSLMSPLELSSDTKPAVEKSTSTNMSSLKISEKSSATNMSSLQISAESENTNSQQRLSRRKTQAKRKSNAEKSFNSGNSFSPLQQDVVKDLLELLDDKLERTPDNVTRRKRQNRKKTLDESPPKKSRGAENELNESLVAKEDGGLENRLEATATNRKKNPDGTSPKKLRGKEIIDSDNRSVAKDVELEAIATNQETNPKNRQVGKPSKKPRGKKSVEKDRSDDSMDLENRYSRRNTIHCLNTRSQSTDLKSVNSSESSENEGEKNRRARKLYDPDEFLADKPSSCDEKERAILRSKYKKEKPDEGVFICPMIVPIKPNLLVSQKVMNYIEKHKDSTGPDDELFDLIAEKAPKKRKSVRKVVNSDDDEQRELAREILEERLNARDEIENRNSKDAKVTPKKSSSGKDQMETPQNTHKVSESSKSSPKKTNSNIKTDKTPKSTRNVPESSPKKISRSAGPTQRRCSTRISRQVLKKFDSNTSSFSSEARTPAPRNRRSSLEFQSKSTLKKKNLKIDKAKKPSIVCTKMHKDEIQVFSQIVRKLGGFVVEDEVSDKTTHLVAGEPKRTINMLRAIANGCWVLKKEWLFKSLEAGKWLPEEDFEEQDFSPAVQQSRLQRRAFGPAYSMDVFRDCAPIYVARDTNPRCSDLRDLVARCRGRVAPDAGRAGVVVGAAATRDGAHGVTVNWILDSVTFGKRMPLRKYRMAEDAGGRASRRSVAV